MTVDPTALTELRLQLDAIDTQLHDLLMQRGELADRIVVAKGSAAAIMRPEREAQIVRRLAKRHFGPFPFAAVARIWREIISAMTSLQGKFAIAVQHPDPGGCGLWETARDHFGSIATYTSHAAAIAVLRAVADGAATVGVLPMPHEGESNAWWPNLLNVTPGSLQIIARLPFIQNVTALERDALVIGRAPIDPSGHDRSLLILETQEQTSRARLLARLAGAGFDVMFMTGQAGGETDEYRHLIEIAGYIDAVDARCRTLMETNPGEFTLVLPIGGYAVPLDLAGEASTPQTD